MPVKSSKNNLFAFIITAAGSGTRMGGGQKKEFRLLDNKPVIIFSIEAFLKASIFSYGLITCKPGTQTHIKKMIDNYIESSQLKKRILLCDGGETRQESVFLGLKHLEKMTPELKKDGFVLIHDGARPWLSTKLIKKIAESCILNKACAPVISSIDAIKTINTDGIITEHLKRSTTVGIQTPQGFPFYEILKAHKLASCDGQSYIDDTEIFCNYSGEVHTIKGDIKNKKITYSHDLPQSEKEFLI